MPKIEDMIPYEVSCKLRIKFADPLAEDDIKKLFGFIDVGSVRIHEDMVKKSGLNECPHLFSIMLDEPGENHCYGFYNFGKDGRFLYYEHDNKHYYVVALYKKELKKVNEKTANQKTLTPIKYYVVDSDGTCFGPCGEDSRITSYDGLKEYVERTKRVN